MKNKKTIITIASAMLMTTALNSAVFNNYANAQDIKINSDNADGKLMLKADVGYVYSFAGDWNKSNAQSPSIGGNKSTATGGVGYGVSLGYSHKSGIGLSADYLGFNHKWTGMGTDVNLKTEFNYDASYHVVTLVPSYRIKLDVANNWGLRVGLGVGFSLSDVAWAQKISASNGAQSGGVKVAGGAVYSKKVLVGGGNVAQPLICGVDGIANSIQYTGDSSWIGKNKCDNGSTYVSNAQIASWLRGLGVTSSDGITLNAGASAVTIDDNGSTNGGIAPEVACLVNGGTWNGAADSKTATNASCVAKQSTAPAPSGGGGGDKNPPPTDTPSASGGSAKDDAGFVLAPQAALEYDNGMLHADLNVKYIHELFNVRYFGSEGSVDGLATSGAITYTSIAGPLALFVGAGLGINF